MSDDDVNAIIVFILFCVLYVFCVVVFEFQSVCVRVCMSERVSVDGWMDGWMGCGVVWCSVVWCGVVVILCCYLLKC